MIRPLLLVALVSLILLGGVQESVPVTAVEPDPNDPCTLLPEGAYEFGAWEQDPSANCLGYYELSDTFRTHVYRVEIFNTGSPADAVRGMQAHIQPDDQTSVTSLGDGGYQVSQGDQDFLVLFTRGPYLVVAEGSFIRGATQERVIGLAEQADQQIAILLGEAPPPEPDADAGAPPDAADDAEPPDGSPDFVDVFYGTEDVTTALGPRLEEVVYCPERDPDPSSRSLFSCAGGEGAMNDLLAFGSSFWERFPNPSEFQTQLGNQLVLAIGLAGLEGRDGRALFPSIRAAMPVIKRLADQKTTYTLPGQDAVSVVQRFVELLAGRDAADWEKRFP